MDEPWINHGLTMVNTDLFAPNIRRGAMDPVERSAERLQTHELIRKSARSAADVRSLIAPPTATGHSPGKKNAAVG
jgi:hypothetical protein